MSHHLNINQRQDVHSAHMQLDGGATFQTVLAQQSFEFSSSGLHPFSFSVELMFEICNECGWMTRPECLHGDGTGGMMWTHRPGCPDPRAHPLPSVRLPAGLVKTFEEAFPDSTRETCEGCLLICPVCGADGT